MLRCADGRRPDRLAGPRVRPTCASVRIGEGTIAGHPLPRTHHHEGPARRGARRPRRHTNDGWGGATFRSEDDARRAAALLRSASWHGRPRAGDELARPGERGGGGDGAPRRVRRRARAARWHAGAAVVTVRGRRRGWRVPFGERFCAPRVDAAAASGGRGVGAGARVGVQRGAPRGIGAPRAEEAARRGSRMLGKGGATIAAAREAARGDRLASRRAPTWSAPPCEKPRAPRRRGRGEGGARRRCRRGRWRRGGKEEADGARRGAGGKARRRRIGRSASGRRRRWRRRAAKAGCAEAAAAAFAALKAAREAAGRGREAVREARSALGKAQTTRAAARRSWRCCGWRCRARRSTSTVGGLLAVATRSTPASTAPRGQRGGPRRGGASPRPRRAENGRV